MTGLSPETQALLERGRDGDDPSEAVIARNRRQLAVRVAGATLGSAAVTGAAGKALAASSSLKLLAIVGVVALGGAALTHGVWRTSERHPPTPAKALVASAGAPRIAALESPPPASSGVPAPPALERAPRAVRTAKSASPTSIQSELELIRGAQQALHRGEARTALTLLAEHAQRFPGGVLAQERDASRVLALCQAGDVTNARAQAERFLQRAPQSAFAERVRNSCAKVKR